MNVCFEGFSVALSAVMQWVRKHIYCVHTVLLLFFFALNIRYLDLLNTLSYGTQSLKAHKSPLFNILIWKTLKLQGASHLTPLNMLSNIFRHSQHHTFVVAN